MSGNGFFMGRRFLRRVLRRGSKKGLSRRHLEGINMPFREYDPCACALFGGLRGKSRQSFGEKEGVESKAFRECSNDH